MKFGGQESLETAISFAVYIEKNITQIIALCSKVI